MQVKVDAKQTEAIKPAPATLDGRTLLFILITIVLWASAFAAIRAGLASSTHPGGYQPGSLALLRFLTASAALAVYAAASRMPLPPLRDWLRLLPLGFVGITVYHVALNYGEVSVPAGPASFLINASPIFTALLATALLGERLKVWGWVGIIVSFIGVTIISLSKAEGFRFDPNALLILLAAFSGSLYFVLQKPLLKKYTALQMTSYGIWAGTLFMLVFLPELLGRLPTADPGATAAGLYLGIFPAALAYVTWTLVLAKLTASRTVSFLYLVPPLATLIAWLWLAEVPPLLALLGGAVALTGVIIVNTKGRLASSPTLWLSGGDDQVWTV